jgi:adenylate kinase
MLERAKVENRSDDTPETIAQRLEVYRNQTAPLLDYYESCGLLASVDGMGTPDEVFQRIKHQVAQRQTG